VEYVSSGETLKGSSFDKNEDHFLIKNEVGLHIVCDGFGEDGRGALASQMTTEFIAQVMIASKKVFQAVNKISVQILSVISKDTVRRQMGTTLSMVLVVGNGVFMAHIGNSRIYLIRDDSVHLLTEDHVTKKQDKNSKMVAEELTLHGLSSNALTRMIGSAQQLKVDLLYFEIMEGDTLLLCTDGAYNQLSENKILEMQKESNDSSLAKNIIDNSREKHITDNATVISISFDQAKMKKASVTPQVKFSTLQKIPLFSEFDYKEMSKLLTFMKMKRIIKDQKVVTQGEMGQDLYIILAGSADVIIDTNKVNELTSGQYFGEVSLIDREPRSATIIATSDLEVLVLNRKDFTYLITHEPQISVKMLWKFAQVLSARVRHTAGGAPLVATDNQKIVLNFD